MRSMETQSTIITSTRYGPHQQCSPLSEIKIYESLYFTNPIGQRTSLNPWGEWMGVLHGDEIDSNFYISLKVQC